MASSNGRRLLMASYRQPLSCPSCRLKTILTFHQISRQRNANEFRTFTSTPSRNASNFASSTAINASKNIPARYQKLYAALEKLQSQASSYVNLSRLQLALKSLEGEDATIRLAILGLGSQAKARRLARLLLADPLSDEEPWEQELKSFDASDSRSLLLQYGSLGQPAPANPLVHTLYVPSTTLARHNLEILISPVVLAETKAGVDAESFKDAALVPMASTPRSFSGSTSFIRYPVHRAIIVAEGIKGCMTLGKQDVDAMRDQEAVIATLDMRSISDAETSNDTEDFAVIDIAEAEKALDTFRLSNANATLYEKGWFASGLPALTAWFNASRGDSSSTLQAPIKNLIEDALSETESSIAKEEIIQAKAPATALSETIREPLDASVRFWAQRAHAELRDELSAAFASRSWAKLRWWKLWWRVDDVEMLAADVLDRSWLTDAERRLLWLVGRATQAGLYDQHEAELRLHSSSATTITTLQATSGIPLQIVDTRAELRQMSLPALHALAQRLVLQTASLAGLSGALSALVYLSVPAAGVYEAGTAAALGVVFALRRMQTAWEGAREGWQADLREKGVLALRGTEEALRTAIRDGGERSADRLAPDEADEEGRKDRERARGVLSAARDALDGVLHG